MRSEFKTAILIHYLGWQSSKTKFALGNGIYIHKLATHNVGKLYFNECKSKNMDNGEPYLYDVCIIIHDWESVASGSGFTTDPYSLVSQLINVIAIYFVTVIDMIRVIISRDNFKQYKHTEVIDYCGVQSEFLLESKIAINDKNIKEIKKIWANMRRLWYEKQSQSRVINALTHFYYSWNVHYIEQTAIYASIVLEILFSPHSKDELSHQIAFNVCQFLGSDKNEKSLIYKKIKNYYSVRSKIVHGNQLSSKEEDVVPEFYKTICAILLKIIGNKKLSEVFDDNNKRKVFLENLIFN